MVVLGRRRCLQLRQSLLRPLSPWYFCIYCGFDVQLCEKRGY
ncbi:hypothetical protein SLEP1_g11507 [Rubroshorea leprosula]|uniref:Uncharacterized protein n=1 Tax=Rubroshorea leprosula TaxID=152421 RepID=A0AAV5IHA8_9ROSI|nr:hypothetical protein SLEP1_g11507 [Rubroshorea leprosula]